MRKILIVEDEEYISHMYQLQFQKAKYKVFIANNGNDAYLVSENEHPDIIILDLLLFGENGYDILKKLKKQKTTKDIPVIIASNLAQDLEIDKGKKLGAIDYVVKTSITPSELVKRVDKLLA